MKLWLATEFNGHRGELISIGLVDEDGREFYEVVHFHDKPDPWVSEHVLPVLHSHDATNKNVLRFQLSAFLLPYASVHIVVDWPADVQHFCEVMLHDEPGERMSTPPLTFEIRRDIDSSASLVPHNAIADARALRLADLASTKP